MYCFLFVHFICISLEFQKEIEYFDHKYKKTIKIVKNVLKS